MGLVMWSVTPSAVQHDGREPQEIVGDPRGLSAPFQQRVGITQHWTPNSSSCSSIKAWHLKCARPQSARCSFLENTAFQTDTLILHAASDHVRACLQTLGLCVRLFEKFSRITFRYNQKRYELMFIYKMFYPRIKEIEPLGVAMPCSTTWAKGTTINFTQLLYNSIPEMPNHNWVLACQMLWQMIWHGLCIHPAKGSFDWNKRAHQETKSE